MIGHKEFANATIYNSLLFKPGAVIKANSVDGSGNHITTEISIAELIALNDLVAADLQKIDGITNGTAAANKALVLGASKEIATITSATITTLTSTTVNSAALTGTTTLTMTSANAAALAVGLAGATNPAFVVDSSTASQAAGLKITGATAAGTVAVAAISSGADANLTINAKGTGTIGIGSVSTGAVTITPALTASGIVTFKTAHSGLIHGCGASGANHSLGATADNALEYYFDATHTTGDMRGQYLRLYFSGAGGSGEAARIFSTINNVSVATGGTVNGAHISIGTAGASAAVSGAANALRVTFGIAAASTNIGGTCSVIQVDTDFDTAVTVPSNFAFLRLTNTNTKKSNNFLRLPNVLGESGGLFCAHVTQTMTHSIKMVSEDGTAYYIMCTNANTNRTES